MRYLDSSSQKTQKIMYVRVFQSIFKEIKFSIFYCFRRIKYAWDSMKMATKIFFLNFPYFYGARATIQGQPHWYQKLPDYPHPLLTALYKYSTNMFYTFILMQKRLTIIPIKGLQNGLKLRFLLPLLCNKKTLCRVEVRVDFHKPRENS